MRKAKVKTSGVKLKPEHAYFFRGFRPFARPRLLFDADLNV
jgi:hypothetical protein